jgi:regulator of nucleoside diphosphate kinase
MTQQKTTSICVTKTDLERLGNLIELVRSEGDKDSRAYVERLSDELEFAETVAPENVPSDVVTMRSKVKLKDLDTREESVYSIVFPTEANLDEGKISILAPIATALLGYKRGDTVEFSAPARVRRLKIEKILYQPESAGDYDL